VIPGVAISMGGREWTIPPLTLGQLRRLMPKVRELSNINTQIGETQIGVLVEIVFAALQRNYPDITIEMVEDLLDLGNAAPVLNAVLTGSGLRPRALQPGEAMAPECGSGVTAAISATAGDISMASLPPLVDTAIRLSTR
jgi:hypothetical protein